MKDRIDHVAKLQRQYRQEQLAKIRDELETLKAEALTAIINKGNWKFFAGVWVGFVVSWALSLL